MDKLQVLLIMLSTAVAGLAVSIYLLALSFSPNESPLSVLSQVLAGDFSPTLPLIIPLTSLLFLSTVLASMGGVFSFLVGPEMQNYATGSSKDTTAVVLRTLRPDERKVVSVLDAHGGAYLQKYVTQEAGLSRLKTHRVVAALSERGIVLVDKKGNTNEVSLVKWFRDGMHQ